jgi:hypothetical protein
MYRSPGDAVPVAPEDRAGFRRFDFEEGRYPRPEEMASAVLSAREAFRARDAAMILSVPRQWVMTRVAELPWW